MLKLIVTIFKVFMDSLIKEKIFKAIKVTSMLKLYCLFLFLLLLFRIPNGLSPDVHYVYETIKIIQNRIIAECCMPLRSLNGRREKHCLYDDSIMHFQNRHQISHRWSRRELNQGKIME